MLAIPMCQIHKERKAKDDKNLDLGDPSDVTVISAIASEAVDTETVSNEKLRSSPPQQSSSDTSSFKQDLGDLKDEWVANFASIEALLTSNASTCLQPGAHAHASPSPGWGVI